MSTKPLAFTPQPTSQAPTQVANRLEDSPQMIRYYRAMCPLAMKYGTMSHICMRTLIAAFTSLHWHHFRFFSASRHRSSQQRQPPTSLTWPVTHTSPPRVLLSFVVNSTHKCHPDALSMSNSRLIHRTNNVILCWEMGRAGGELVVMSGMTTMIASEAYW